MRRLSLVLVVLVATVATARAEQPIENGCGPSGILSWIVPDYIPIAGCKLTTACNAHDRCYSKCLAGQPLHGKPTCEDQTARTARRLVCDNRLRSDIIVANPGSWTCRGIAGVYRRFVVRYGLTHFHGFDESTLPIKEELYKRRPEATVQNFTFEPPAEIRAQLKLDFEAMQGFTRYLEQHPGTFDEAEARAAIDAAAELGAETKSRLAFTEGPNGASLVLTSPDTPDTLLWQSATP